MSTLLYLAKPTTNRPRHWRGSRGIFFYDFTTFFVKIAIILIIILEHVVDNILGIYKKKQQNIDVRNRHKSDITILPFPTKLIMVRARTNAKTSRTHLICRMSLPGTTQGHHRAPHHNNIDINLFNQNLVSDLLLYIDSKYVIDYLWITHFVQPGLHPKDRGRGHCVHTCNGNYSHYSWHLFITSPFYFPWNKPRSSFVSIFLFLIHSVPMVFVQ